MKIRLRQVESLCAACCIFGADIVSEVHFHNITVCNKSSCFVQSKELTWAEFSETTSSVMVKSA